ncbi:Zn-dependent alcohol dehydrogenase [Rhodanobacter sp. K2T2]|uniref:carboxypeptidase-like regulatory domain-containing protein n=1 Tax=Rhodanobacter sp. K2T2 TaxID=2723085 RepID=UPI0015C8C8B7|nr:carboxypeptidase-like regulatory domain-containing protein [Rhodanobacter sp. K2T2]NYE27637.1 Zn-dependent alcohol dehydrogenase [Rhodanobacter sp. K2T2]
MNPVFSPRFTVRRIARRLALAGVIGACTVASISTASAQDTAGAVFGKAPLGYSVAVRSDATGAGRTVKVDASGRYSAHALPTGTYTVTLKQSGQDVAKHLNVPVIAGRGVEVDFNCSEIKCDEVAKMP